MFEGTRHVSPHRGRWEVSWRNRSCPLGVCEDWFLCPPQKLRMCLERMEKLETVAPRGEPLTLLLRIPSPVKSPRLPDTRPFSDSAVLPMPLGTVLSVVSRV